MSSPPCFLSLPRELRTSIYLFYLAVEDGYVYDFRSGKLTTADNQPIDLALMYTCRLAAEEMKGLPFRANTITFSTVSSDCGNLRERAGRFENLMWKLHLLRTSWFESATPFIPTSVYDEVVGRYPRFRQFLDESMKGGEWYTWDTDDFGFGEVPSFCRVFIQYTLQLGMEKSMRFDEAVCKANTEHHCSSPDPHHTISLSLPAWNVPTIDDLDEITFLVGIYGREGCCWRPWKKHCFSAAAAAIDFLHSIPRSTRTQIRNILLNEDRRGVSDPECHARGLISFCQENPLLGIERRVSLWRCIFQYEGSAFPGSNFIGCCDTRIDPRLCACGLSRNIARWVVEALALIPAGMPADSFSLVLDGEPAPKKCTEIFQRVVLRDVACQAALEECHPHDFRTEPPFRQKRNNWYYFEGFPQAINDIVNNASIVGCNFSPGKLWDVEEFVKERRGWDKETWNANWYDNIKQHFRTPRSLPKWRDLCNEVFITT